MNIKGIDISYYQKGLKIADVKKAGFEFAILRGGVTGNGVTRPKYKDSCFEDFYAQAKAIGFPVGVYYYSCANTRQGGIDEANFLYENCLKGKQFEYPVYIDIEDGTWHKDKAANTEAILGFIETLNAKGFYAGVYSSTWWYNNRIDTPKLDKYTKWVANWSAVKPSFAYSNFDVWQNSESGKIGAFRVDTDFCYRDLPSYIKSNGLNGYTKPQPQPPKKSIDEIAQEVIAGRWGAGEERKKRLAAAGYDYAKVQAKVNELMNPKKTVDEIAREVIAGKWGAGAVRKSKLTAAGYDYNAVQARVAELMPPKKKTVTEIAKEVIAGLWGAGEERKKKLTAAGYNYTSVQRKVNELMKK